MASNEIDISTYEDEEEILEKFKKERKELQAQLMKLKHSVPKGDKKRKKEVQEEIAKLEAALEAKQQTEMEKWKAASKTTAEPEAMGDNLSPAEVGIRQEETEEGEEPPHLASQGGKKSKAQRRREKKQSKDKEREERIKEQEVANRHGPRQVELLKVAALLRSRGLALHEIAADGNCMYNAVAHQLAGRNMQTSNGELRQKTSDYMRAHPDDFLPFLTNNDTGDMMSPDEYEEYCNKTAKMPVWGGQLELRALSEVLRIPIEVLQADVKPLLIGDSTLGKPITVIYQRHAYRLGEHYNSVTARREEDDKDGDSESIQQNGLT